MGSLQANSGLGLALLAPGLALGMFAHEVCPVPLTVPNGEDHTSLTEFQRVAQVPFTLLATPGETYLWWGQGLGLSSTCQQTDVICQQVGKAPRPGG